MGLSDSDLRDAVIIPAGCLLVIVLSISTCCCLWVVRKREERLCKEEKRQEKLKAQQVTSALNTQDPNLEEGKVNKKDTYRRRQKKLKESKVNGFQNNAYDVEMNNFDQRERTHSMDPETRVTSSNHMKYEADITSSNHVDPEQRVNSSNHVDPEAHSTSSSLAGTRRGSETSNSNSIFVNDAKEGYNENTSSNVDSSTNNEYAAANSNVNIYDERHSSTTPKEDREDGFPSPVGPPNVESSN